MLTLQGHIKTAEQRAIIRQYGDWYTGCWWLCCYIWYSEEGPGQAAVPPSPLLAVPNVTAHPSTASVPTFYYSMWHYNCHGDVLLFVCLFVGLSPTLTDGGGGLPHRLVLMTEQVVWVPMSRQSVQLVLAVNLLLEVLSATNPSTDRSSPWNNSMVCVFMIESVVRFSSSSSS